MKKIIVLLLVLLTACKEDIQWLKNTDLPTPMPPSGVSVKNLGGGSIIYFDSLVDDETVIGIKAHYKYTEEGDVQKTIVSTYSDSIMIMGFPTVGEREVKLSTVNINGVESDPLIVTLDPEIPPVQNAAENCEIYAIFGGVSFSVANETGSSLGVICYYREKDGLMNEHNRYYSSQKKIDLSFRGLDAEPTEFMFEITDEYGNAAQTEIQTLTPKFEEFINPKNEYGVYVFNRPGHDLGVDLWRGDHAMDKSECEWRLMFDGRNIVVNNGYWNGGDEGNPLKHYLPTAQEPEASKQMFPIYFTIDLGRKINMNRLKTWMRSREPYDDFGLNTHRYWQEGNPKYFNVYGCKEMPQERDVNDGTREGNLKYWTSWPEVGGTDEWKNDWKLLGEGSHNVPSGNSPYNALESDFQYADQGYDLEVSSELTNEEIRYLRFEIKETWDGNTGRIHIAEINVYGEEIE